jgi:hypothetical protein
MLQTRVVIPRRPRAEPGIQAHRPVFMGSGFAAARRPGMTGGVGLAEAGMQVGVLQFFSWPERRVELASVYARVLRRIRIPRIAGAPNEI